MHGRVVVLASLLAVVGASSQVAAQAPAQAPGGDTASHRGFLARHCTSCHNQRLKTAGLSLDTLNLSEVGAHVAIWEKVVAKLRAGAMPPVGRPQPDEAARTTFVTWLETELDRAAAGSPNPGRPAAFHRLNRTEYQNAIRDLLALELDVSRLLPARRCGVWVRQCVGRAVDFAGAAGRVFVGRAPHQQAGGWRSDRVSGSRRPTPSARCSSRKSGMSEDLPFGSRGGAAVRHTFPLDGEYVLKLRFDGPGDGRGPIRDAARRREGGRRHAARTRVGRHGRLGRRRGSRAAHRPARTRSAWSCSSGCWPPRAGSRRSSRGATAASSPRPSAPGSTCASTTSRSTGRSARPRSATRRAAARSSRAARRRRTTRRRARRGFSGRSHAARTGARSTAATSSRSSPPTAARAATAATSMRGSGLRSSGCSSSSTSCIAARSIRRRPLRHRIA